MKKRVLALLLAFCLFAGFTPSMAHANGEEDWVDSFLGFQYHYTSDKITLIGYERNGPITFLPFMHNIPLSTPIYVGEEAFSNRDDLTTVDLPDSYVNIGVRAFAGCRNLSQLSLPNYASIEEDAFLNCPALKEVTVPAFLPSIGAHALGYCWDEQTGYTLLEGFSITGYEDTAAQAYAEENGIPFHSLGAVEDMPAPGVDDLIYTIENGEVTITSCNKKIIGSLTVPETIEGYPVTALKDACFAYCMSVTEIILPDTITRFEEFDGGNSYTFNGCLSLERIVLPPQLTSIGAYAFWSCTSLTEIDIPKGVTELGDYAFDSCSSLTAIELPSQLNRIGYGCFRDCSSLSQVVIPNSVSSLNSYAFSGCVNLVEATLPEGITDIPTGLFSGCTGLTEFSIPDTVTWIRNDAFRDTGLKRVSIPASVKRVDESAFCNCAQLTDVSFTTTSHELTFGMSAFSYCTALTNISIPNNVTYLTNNMFAHCTSLNDIYIPSSVRSIGSGCFEACPNLKEIYIPSSVTRISPHAYGYGWSNKNFALLDGVTIYGAYHSAAQTYADENGIAFVGAYRPFADDNNAGTWTWAGDYIYACASNNLISGYPDDTFLPDGNISRVEFLSILYRTYLINGGVSIPVQHPFQDATGDWYQDALNWGYYTGVVSGTSDTTFSPNAKITRQDMAAILYRYLTTFYEEFEPVSCNLNQFPDRKQIASYARPAMEFCVYHGIISGTADGGKVLLAPQSTATRAQAATIIAQTFS